MKTRNAISIIAIVAIITIGFIACDGGDEETHTHTWGAWQRDAAGHWQECTAADGAKTAEGSHTGNPCTVCGYETPHEPQPTPKTLTFGKITVSSPDEYLSDEWNDLVDDLVASLEAMYLTGSSDDKESFREPLAFGDNGLKIVLKSDLPTNWEVKKTLPEGTGVKGTLYIKTGSIGSIDKDNYMLAVIAVANNNSTTSVTKASPAKGGVFLAQTHKAADTVSKSNQLYC
jgi:hypothetical protein